MGRYVEGINVNQMIFGFPLESMIEDDNPVRAIDIIREVGQRDKL